MCACPDTMLIEMHTLMGVVCRHDPSFARSSRHCAACPLATAAGPQPGVDHPGRPYTLSAMLLGPYRDSLTSRADPSAPAHVRRPLTATISSPRSVTDISSSFFGAMSRSRSISLSKDQYPPLGRCYSHTSDRKSMSFSYPCRVTRPAIRFLTIPRLHIGSGQKGLHPQTRM